MISMPDAGCCCPKADLLSLLLYFQSFFLENILPLLLRANRAIVIETYVIFRNEEWNGHEAMVDEEQALHLAFRAMGKDLDNITTEAIKAYIFFCRNSSLPDLALNVEL
jgi:hypothetical protein